MKNYLNFNNYTFSEDFINIIKNIDSIISDKIIDSYNNKDSFRYNRINITNDIDMVSYNILNGQTVQYVKLGKIINKLYPREFTNTDIEEFVNQYKAEIRNDLIFNIVDGEDIRLYYKDEYSDNDGTIGSSCMRHNRCQEYLDIYTENPDKVKLLILFKKINNIVKPPRRNKIIGRALLWYADNLNKFVMDKIYISNYEYKFSFEKYRKENNILTLDEPIDMYSILKPGYYKHYPFLDNLFLYQPKTGIITNSIKYTDSSYKVIILDDTYGYARVYGASF